MPLAPLLASEPEAFGRMTRERMAVVAVSFIEGCALQAVIDSASFDVAAYGANLDALLDPIPRRR